MRYAVGKKGKWNKRRNEWNGVTKIYLFNTNMYVSLMDSLSPIHDAWGNKSKQNGKIKISDFFLYILFSSQTQLISAQITYITTSN
jgi:hypothetical protein